MVDDETGLRRETVRSEPGAVTVACAYQQIGPCGGLHHLVFDPAASFHASRRPGPSRGGGGQKILCGRRGERLDSPTGIALGWMATA